MALEVLLILVLVLANGVFAMTELAIISARRARLKRLADDGNRNARTALALSESPDDFLSTVQVGITLISTLAAAFGGATLAHRLEPTFAAWPGVAPYAEKISFAIVVIGMTYISLILGELAPKRVALARPEGIAAAMAPVMQGLSKATHPVVRLLSFSTDMVMAILPTRKSEEPPVTQEEIKVLLEQGTKAGAFHEAEQELVAGVFRLADRRAAELMTPRHQVIWIDRNAGTDELRRVFTENPHSRMPVADGSLDRIAGLLYVKDLFAHWTGDTRLDLTSLIHTPLFVPEATGALRVLEMFQQSGTHFAVVLNEHGGVEGILTITDLLEAIVGDLPAAGETPSPAIAQREDGSWLVRGTAPLSELREQLRIGDLPGEDRGTFTTVGGLVMMTLERIPRPGDYMEAGEWRFEVVDMDGHRVDQVLISGPGHGRPAIS
jgi:putative hemolysin